jgi:phosphoribosylanthranilate isomerase
MKIKVCGITKIEQLKELEEIGVDFAGLIFYKASPRYVLDNGLTPEIIKKENVKINKVGVFVNESVDAILKIVDDWKLDMVQLHGDETPKLCAQISGHVTTIKVFRVGLENNIDYKLFPYMDDIDLFLFDTLGKKYGGTGEQFDWNLISNGKNQKSYFLSGGIGPKDVDKLKEFCKGESRLFSLDVNSKFEVSPGVKDMKLVKVFTEEIQKIN